MNTTGQPPCRRGFTLVELLVVIAIIGIILSAILVAAADGVRRAEERATQSLITKLDVAVNDRIDALFNTQAPINYVHRFLASISYNSTGSIYLPIPGSVEARAQVIAQNDFLRSEFPDVFYLNSATTDGAAYAGKYPLNFAAIAFPPSNPSKSEADYFLPLGHPWSNQADPNTSKTFTIAGAKGVFGASFSAAGGIYKNLGYPAKAYDGVDNTGNGYIDELGEAGFSSTDLDAFNAKLAKHTHKTARSEMLYAVLVEGLGPLGSVFSREDFTSKEIQDTDGDGLPEFVDAWGEPIQFFRWPIYFGAVLDVAMPPTSDSQKGYAPYSGLSDVRQQDPFDPNQLLTAPGWWSSLANPAFRTDLPFSASFAPTNAGLSQGAVAFTTYFRSLVDPGTSTLAGSQWDRTGTLTRRAYFSKPLILSSGPDKEPGVAQLNKNYNELVDTPVGSNHTFAFPDPTKTIQVNTQYLTLIENQASQTDPLDRSGAFSQNPTTSTTGIGFTTTQYLRNIAGTDDITNHLISAPGTGVR